MSGIRFSLCLWLFALLTTVEDGQCNQMDPHVFPANGAYFEGWYMRVIDFTQGASIGWIFNQIRPENKTSHTKCQNYSTKLSPSLLMRESYECPIMITHLVSSGPSSKLSASYVLLSGDGYNLTENGHPIHKNPDDKSLPEFEAHMGEHISFIVKGGGTNFSISFGDSVFRGETSSPVPWGPKGEGPESYLEHFPLPLHWFVYSLRSNVKYYEYTNKKTGQVIKGGSQLGQPVIAHMEKNWGGAFPKAWIWAEGVNPSNNASFACTSGLLHELFLDVKAELSGYRNPSKDIICNFHPLNSIHVLDHDGCQGYAKLKAEGVDCSVMFDIYVDPSLLSSCLITPQVTGYKLGCVESYNAVANVTVFQRQGLQMTQTDSQIFKMAAIEFGGTFMCDGKCPN